jgi:hypothetical protein
VIGTILRPASYMDYMDIEVTAGTWSSDANSRPRRSCSPESTWSNVSGRTIAYPGDDTAEFEQSLRQFMPSWMAFDMRLMADSFPYRRAYCPRQATASGSPRRSAVRCASTAIMPRRSRADRFSSHPTNKDP